MPITRVLSFASICTTFVILIALASFRLVYERTPIISITNVSDSISEPKEQLTKYCNYLESIQLNDERINFANSENIVLDKVIVVIRHGDRGPLRAVKNLDSLRCGQCNRYNHLNNEDAFYLKLAEKFLSNRKKLQRYNFSRDFIDLPQEKCKIGRLTKLGICQHIKLGFLLSEAYSSKLRLNASQDALFSALMITTTKKSRTFQSSFAFLYGFYHQLNAKLFEKLPKFIFSHNPYFCGLNETSRFCRPCDAYTNLRTELDWTNLLSPSELGSINRIIKHSRLMLAPNVFESFKYSSLVSIFDAMNSYICHDDALPCDSPNECVTLNQVKNVQSFICLLGKRLQASRAYQYSSWLKMFGFLNNLINVIHRQDLTKFILFSGHDIGLEALKATLGLDSDCEIPPYASRFIFEIFSTKNQKFLRIIFNGKDITEHTDIEKTNVFVTNQAISISLIKMENFEAYIDRKFKSLTDSRDYESACYNRAFEENGATLDEDRL